MVGSVSRVVAACFNTAMESLFSLSRKNVLDRQVWITREDLRIVIVTWIEPTDYHRRRLAICGRLTPIEVEAIMTTPLRQAVRRTCALTVQQTQDSRAHSKHVPASLVPRLPTTERAHARLDSNNSGLPNTLAH